MPDDGGTREWETMRIRSMTKADAETVARLFVETDPEVFPTIFSPIDAFVGYVRSTCEDGGFLSTGNVRIAEEGGQAVGMCVTYDAPPRRIGGKDAGHLLLGEDFDRAVESQAMDAEMALGFGCSYLDCLSVDAGFRRQGVGRALVDDAKEGRESLMLLCRADNSAASALYGKAGFRSRGMTLGLSEDGGETGPAMRILVWERPDTT